MACMARRLLMAVLLGGTLALPAAHAQTPNPPSVSPPPAEPLLPELTALLDDLPAALPAPSGTDTSWEPEFLRSLPRPLDQPRSLFQPARAPGLPPPDLERPYFQWDPILDPTPWPQPGWFWNVQIAAIHPHIVSEANNADHPIRAGGHSTTVALGNGRMNWTIAPRIELGYRLPSGFGQFSVADRFFNSSGTGPYRTADGSATRSDRLSVNYTDFDYGSQEYTPWANWTMKWRVGVRQAETYIRTSASESFTQAAAGGGVFAAQTATSTAGAGMHFGVELDRRIFGTSGLSFVNRFDVGDVFSRLYQDFAASTTTLGPTGRPESGFVKEAVFMQLPMLNWQFGLGWQPPSHPNVHVFAGYLLDAWWNVERRTGTTSNGNFTNQGVVLQAGVNF